MRWFELDPFFVFHFLNGWDDGDTVVIDGCSAERSGCTAHRYGYLGHTREWGADIVTFDGVIKVDNQTGDSHVHVYGPHHESGEAVFAANPDGTDEDDGWLLNPRL